MTFPAPREASKDRTASSGAGVPFAPDSSGPLSVLRYRFSPLRRFEDFRRRHGAVTGFSLFGQSYVVLHDPGAIEQVLVSQHMAFEKDVFTQQLRAVLGHGLLTSEGESWKRHRKLTAPSMQPREMARYAGTMVERTEVMADEMGRAGGSVRDIHADMMHLTLDILVRTLFGYRISGFETVESELGAVMRMFRPMSEMLRAATPGWLPLPSRVRLAMARRRLIAIIDAIIADKRCRGGDDLLSRLIAATDESGGFGDEQLRDEALTLFLAGHETTALALTYALRLLALHPDVLGRLRAELNDELGERTAGFEDLPKLRYTRAVVEESMRLFPPAWAMGRRAVDECVIAGWRIPRGTQLIISQWSMHRHPRYFREPERFMPERWLGDPALPRFVYFPFGGGPRICVGHHFAMTEATLVLAGLVQRLAFRLERPERFDVVPSVTLRPKFPVRMTVQPRDAAS